MFLRIPITRLYEYPFTVVESGSNHKKINMDISPLFLPLFIFNLNQVDILITRISPSSSPKRWN